MDHSMDALCYVIGPGAEDVEIDFGEPGGRVNLAPYQTWYTKQAQHWGQRRRCHYCRQLSPDDSRGGCAACGGPRPEYKPPKMILKNWRI